MTILEQLKRAGAVLIRSKKHRKWRLPNGQVFTMSRTPSDWRAEKNQLATLKLALKKKVVAALAGDNQ